MNLMILIIIIIQHLTSSSSALVVVKQAQNIIKLNNEVKLINKYDNVTLKCPIEGDDGDGERRQPTQLIKWFKNDENLKLFNKNKIRVINNNYLLIRNFNVYDIGMYKCQIISGNGAIRMFNITLRVNLTSKEINELLFNYDASIDKNGDDDEDEDDNIEDYILDSNSVDINQNTYDYYSRGGEAPSFIDLDSLINKQFQKLEHSQIELTCNARGMPMPDIMWLKNNQVISEENIGNTRNSMILKISDVSIHDSGVYTCQLTNEFGKINRTFIVSVYEQIAFKGLDPINQTVVYGSFAKFNCEVADNFDKQFTTTKWLVQYSNEKFNSNGNLMINDNLSFEINNELYVYLNSKNDNIEIKNSYLLINQVTYHDIGYYLCIINNSRGYNYRKAYLNVIQSFTNSIQTTNSNLTPNIPLVTVILCVFAAITAFLILGLFICFCKNKPSNDVESRGGKNIIIKKPQLPQPLMQQQQQLKQPQHQFKTHYYPAAPQFNTFSSSLRKSITSQRSSHVNTTSNTNTNSTTITKLNDLNYTPETILLLNNQQNQNLKLIYQLNDNTRRVPEYDNYKNIKQQLSNTASLSIDDDMIDWSDSSSNISRPYAKIQYYNNNNLRDY